MTDGTSPGLQRGFAHKPSGSQSRIVVVCVCTRDRSESFARCLRAVLAQKLAPEDHELKVVVVDNSSAAKERGRVEALARQNAPVTYVHEPEPGIPLARNAALEAALELGPSWVAFIDDDEVAPVGWLSRLLEIAQLTGADVVHGGLVGASAGEVEVLAAAWCARDAVPKVRRTHKAATNNVLFRPWLVAEPIGLRFDTGMREHGGSDGEFFMRVADAGAVIVRTADATVFEEMSKERETAAWQRKRAFRVGTNCNYRYRKNRKPSSLAAALIVARAAESSARGLSKALSSLLLLPVNVSHAGALAKEGTVDLCFAWGCVAPYFGVGPKSYY